MRYEHAKLLLDFSRLQLRIALARRERGDVVHVSAEDLEARKHILDVPVTDATIVKSIGYRKLREFFVRLPKRKQDKLAIDWRRQITAIEAVVSQAKKTGEVFTYADVELTTTDAETGIPFPNPAQEQPE